MPSRSGHAPGKGRHPPRNAVRSGQSGASPVYYGIEAIDTGNGLNTQTDVIHRPMDATPGRSIPPLPGIAAAFSRFF